MSMCSICVHHEACKAWIMHGKILYSDFDYCTDDCQQFKNDYDFAKVVHGRWIHCNGKSNLWYCSECGEKILYNPTRRTYNIEKRPVHEVNKYCRGCGATMDGGNNNGICEKS